MKCVYVSNGNATPEVLEYLRPYLTGMKIDLKSMQDKNYRQLGGVLKNVLDTIKRVKEMGLWLEVVTLVVPGFNDSNAELWEAARFLSGVSADIPWHVTAFHSDYKMSDTDNTPARTLLRAAEIGREAGLHYVYAGNLPGRVDEYETTFCPKCNTALVKRTGYLHSRGKCHTPGNLSAVRDGDCRGLVSITGDQIPECAANKCINPAGAIGKPMMQGKTGVYQNVQTLILPASCIATPNIVQFN